jgi:TonB-dependent starch-binding outer membrane protein SusC
MKKITRLMGQLWVATPLVCCLHFQTYAQDIASLVPAAVPALSAENQRQDDRGKPAQPLKKYLAELESRYKVSFNYDSELIGNLVVESQVEMDENIETSLNTLLKSKGLQCKKIGSDTYVIYPKQEMLEPRKSSLNADADVSAVQAFSSEGMPLMAARTSLLHRPLVAVRINATVTGRVTDEKGEGLPGVSVILKGTTTGTATDVNGGYSLNVPDLTGTLVFSFVGYLTQEIPLNNRETVDVSLAPDVKTLSEVVVIGYQTVQKKDLTGAVSTISPTASNRVTANSVAESIQGLSPGVTVRSGGAPGQMARIEIRGAASFTNTDPLYVIDGMIADANTTINNNDIESIQVLKDASAAAIYGSRAANGVVIITTKQGKEGPARVSASAKYGIQQIPKRWDVMNNTEFAAMQRQQYQNTGGQTPPSSVGTSFDPSINTNWQDEVMRTGSLQDYNVTLSGGSKTGTYLVSGSFFTNTGVLIGNSFERGSLRVNTRSQKGRVTFGENIVLTNTVAKLPGEGNPFYDLPQMLPIIPVRGERYINETNPEGWGIGTTDAVTYAFNSVAINNLNSVRNNFAKLVGNAYVDVKIAEWLSYKFNVGAEVSFDHFKNVRKLGVWQFNAAPKPSSVNEERSRYLSLLFEHTLNFSKVFGVHNINGVIGISQQNTNRETTAGGRTNLQIYNGNYLTTIGSGTGESTAGGGIPIDYRIFGYLGRLNYTFNDKYLLTLTGRIDQDSRFGVNYRTGFFPSVALGWRISQEDFFRADWVNDLKLHASYGQLGIVTLNSWDYTAFINNNPRAVFGPDQFPYVGAAQAQLANPNLKWEERIVQNIGVDASFLNNQISLSVEAYNSLSKDNLLQLPVAGYLGNLGGNPFVNAGSIRNTGVEVAATYRNNNNELKWDVSANMTTIRNRVVGVGNQGEGIDYIQVGNTRTKVGRSLGEWYLLRTSGLFQSDDEAQNYRSADGKVIQPFAKAGDVKYVDLNGDGQINNDDRDFVGSPWPTLQTGAQFNASYRGFNLNIQLVGVFGYKLYNDTRRILDSYQRTNFRRDVSPWSPTNTGTSDPRLALDTEQGVIDNNRANSDRWLESGSYLRLRNVEIGYNLPKPLLSGAGIQNARVFISGQNLFTITSYSGLDPDVVGNTDPNNSQARILERGVDLGNWPASRVFSIGVQCDF